jgi:Protein of unknown function (DUF3102)
MSDVTPLSPKDPLADLAARIRDYHKQVEEVAKNLVQKAILAGTALIDAKRQKPHGGWLPWLKNECGLLERTAQRYMELASGKAKLEQKLRDKSVTMSDLTLNQALRLIRDDQQREGDGSMGKYQKAQATLIKKLNDLSPYDVVDAAESTIAALQKVIEAKKPAQKAA